MSGNLDGFLGKGGEGEDEGAPPPEQQEQRQEPERQEDQAPPAEQQDDDAEAHAGPTIPRSAFIKAREDWKAKAVRAETEAAERARQLADVQRQLDELRKAPPAPPQPVQQQPQRPEPPPLPDPETNPAGYVAALIERQQQAAQQMIVAERFNASEARLRDKIGDAEVDAMVAEFQHAAQQDPMLGAALHQQRDPFAWAHKQMQARRAQAEIGTDPAAYRARLEAELREKIAAEMAAAQPGQPQRPAVPRLQPSLANGRSAAPRGLGQDNDDTDVPLADILRR